MSDNDESYEPQDGTSDGQSSATESKGDGRISTAELMRTRLTATWSDLGEGDIPCGPLPTAVSPMAEAENALFNVLVTTADAPDESFDFRIVTSEIDLQTESLDGQVADSYASRYEILRTIAVDESGQTVLARDHNTERTVTVTFLHPSLARDVDRLDRFLIQARIPAAIGHPNVLPIYDVDISDSGMAYFTSRQLPELDLATCLQERQDGITHPIIGTIYDMLSLMSRVADAVGAAHQAGYVHQDIKPEHILIDAGGDVVLSGWSAAQAIDPGEGELRFAGTPVYMAPEQARREHLDARSDVYALGVTCFELFYGRLPCWSADETLFWERKRAGLIDQPQPEERAAVPATLAGIIALALSPRADERPADGMVLAQLLRDAGRELAANGVAPQVVPVGGVVRWIAAVACLAVAALATLLVIAPQPDATVAVSEPRPYWSLVQSADFTTPSATTDWQASGAADLTIDDRSLAVTAGAAGAADLLTALPAEFRLACTLRIAAGTELDQIYIDGRGGQGGYGLRLSADDASPTLVLRDGQPLQEVAGLPPMRPGQRYRLEISRRGDQVRFVLNGGPLFAFDDPLPTFSEQQLGFGIALRAGTLWLDDLRIESFAAGDTVPVLTIGDHLARAGRLTNAVQAYRSVAGHYPDQDLGRIAAFRAARCLWALGDGAEALGIAERLLVQAQPAGLTQRLSCLMLAARLDTGDLAGALAAARRLSAGLASDAMLQARLLILVDQLLPPHLTAASADERIEQVAAAIALIQALGGEAAESRAVAVVVAAIEAAGDGAALEARLAEPATSGPGASQP